MTESWHKPYRLDMCYQVERTGGSQVKDWSVIGKSVLKPDALEKVTGRAKYCADVELPRMLYAKVLRSKYPHAGILSIDTSEAEKLPGVKAVVTSQDIIKEKIEIIFHARPDIYPLAVDKVRFVGEEVAAVAAEDELTAEEALGLIRVEYEVLPAVFDPEESMKPGAPRIYDDVKNNIAGEAENEFGDVVNGFKEADRIFEDRFVVPYIHACHLEPTACIASFDSSGKLTFYENSMDPFARLKALPQALGIPASKIKVVQKFIGGNFGCRQADLSPYVITAILASKSGRPVRLVHTREEEFTSTRPRMPEIIYLKTGVKKDGTLTARHIRVIATAGAHIGRGKTMMVTGLAVAAGLYRCPNVRLEGKCVYTNTVPVGPVRSFGISQPQFAVESQMDMIAEELGVDPIELRLKNATRTGDVTLIGQKIASCGLQECLEKVTHYIGWKEKRTRKRPNRGIGIACQMDHSDNRSALFGGSTAYVKVLEDGKIRIISGEFEWGQGSHTTLSQVAAEELDVPPENVEFSEMDTDVVPYTLGPYGGGRLFVTAGHAVRLAAIDARKQLLASASKMLLRPLEDLELKNQKIFVRESPEKMVSIADAAGFARYTGNEILGKGVHDPDTDLLDEETIRGNYSSAYMFLAHAVEVEVEPETGRVTVLNLASANDVGKAINPLIVEGQIEGGVASEVGIALLEEINFEQGIVTTTNFTDYKIPTAKDVPPIKTFAVESNDPVGPYGAKGIAHAGMPAPPALANAIYDAVGVRIKELPITPMKILKALEEKKGL